jgi:chemotaxis-related protein WspB
VIDLTFLLSGCPSRRVLNTRIILVDYPDKRGTQHILGILAERIGISDRQEKRAFVDTGVRVPDAPYLGNISIDDQEMTQVVDIDKLLPDSLRESLFTEQETSAS